MSGEPHTSEESIRNLLAMAHGKPDAQGTTINYGTMAAIMAESLAHEVLALRAKLAIAAGTVAGNWDSGYMGVDACVIQPLREALETAGYIPAPESTNIMESSARGAPMGRDYPAGEGAE